MIYVTDWRRGAVLALDALATGAGFNWLDGNPMDIGPMTRPSGIALDASGGLIVADTGKHRIVTIDPATGATAVLHSGASDIGPLRGPAGVALTAAASLVIADQGNHRIVFTALLPDAEWSAFGSPGMSPGGFMAPTGVHVDHAGRILVADPGAARLVRIDAPDGSGWTDIALPAGPGLARPYALAAGPDGGILVTDVYNHRILLLAGEVLSVLIDGAGDYSLMAPVGVAMLGGDIVVAEAGAARISRWARDDAGIWSAVEQLDGRGGPGGGPEFSALTSLTVKEQP